MPGFLSIRSNWVPPSPATSQGSVAPPSFGSKEGDTLACGGVGGGPNSDEGTDLKIGSTKKTYPEAKFMNYNFDEVSESFESSQT